MAVALAGCGVSCDSTTERAATEPRTAGVRVEAGPDIDAGEGDEVALSAAGRGGHSPYHFRWHIERRPEGADEVALSGDTGAEVRTSALTIQGRYVFRVVVVDSADRDAYDFVTIQVGPPGTGLVQPIEVRIAGPDKMEPDQPGTLRAITDASTNGDLTFLWETVTSNGVVFETPDQPRTLFTVDESGTVVVRVTVKDETLRAAGSAEHTIEVMFEGALAVVVEGPNRAQVNEPIDLTAAVTNDPGGLTFAWTLTDGTAELTGADQPTVNFRATSEGRLAVEVKVTDPVTEATATAEYVVTVSPGTPPLTLRASGPDILRTGESGALAVQFDKAGLEDISFRWEVVAGSATLDDPAAETPNLISSNGETVQARVTVTATDGSETRVGTADAFVVTYAEERPQVGFTIAEFGEFVFELRPDVAPKTVANLLRYVDDGFYDGLVIHRVVPDFVIQGGGFNVNAEGKLAKAEVRDPVPGEANLSNVRGTVAMALVGSDANSGTSQWFINLVDNTADGDVDLDIQNFTVFGSVVEGMDVVDQIAAVETNSGSDFEGLPVENIMIESAERRP